MEKAPETQSNFDTIRLGTAVGGPACRAVTDGGSHSTDAGVGQSAVPKESGRCEQAAFDWCTWEHHHSLGNTQDGVLARD